MAHKQVLFRSTVHEKILRGATQFADAIRVTLGPRSKAVLIENKWGAPIVCNDVVTIAKEFDLKDPEENLASGRQSHHCPFHSTARNMSISWRPEL
jgi:chaperonin GroEL